MPRFLSLPSCLAVLFATCLLWPGAANALDVTGVRFGGHDGKQRVVLELSEAAKFKAYILEKPDRVIIDLPDAGWKVGAVQAPPATTIRDIRHGDIGNHVTRIVLQTSSRAEIASSFLLPADAKQPDRVVVDFHPGVTTGAAPAPDMKMGAALPKPGKPARDKDARPHSASTVQNLAALMPLPVKTTPIAGKEAPAKKVQPLSARENARKAAEDVAIMTAEKTAPPLKDRDLKAGAEPDDGAYEPPTTRNRQKPLVIIDPGHGGQDPGARAANGNYEKTIVLAVGLELKRVLEQSGQYRVSMTRATDVFIPLKERVKFARRNGGDLFISLHADSMSNAAVSGASVYTLSDTASDKEAEKLAERENKSDAIAGVNLSNQDNDVANILIDLASRDTMNQSRYLANTVVSTLPGNGVGMLARKPHRSAGFAVLKAMDIPSILVEMGYLTNPEEADRLSSRAYRLKIANGLKGSVDAYFTKIAKLNTP